MPILGFTAFRRNSSDAPRFAFLKNLSPKTYWSENYGEGSPGFEGRVPRIRSIGPANWGVRGFLIEVSGLAQGEIVRLFPAVSPAWNILATQGQTDYTLLVTAAIFGENSSFVSEVADQEGKAYFSFNLPEETDYLRRYFNGQMDFFLQAWVDGQSPASPLGWSSTPGLQVRVTGRQLTGQ